IVTSIGDLAYPLGFCGSGGFLYGGDDGAYFYDIDSGETKKEEEFDSYVSVFGSPEGTITLVATDSEILGIDNHGDVAYRIDIHEYFDDGDLFATAAAFDAGNFIIAFEGDGNHYMLIGNGETGAVRFSLENEGNGVGSLALKGDNVYYSVEDYNGPGFTYMSKAYSIDLKSGTTRWENDLVDFSVTSIDIAGEYVYLSNMSSVIVIDDVTGNAAQIYTTTSGIIETWTDEDNMYYLDFDGNITFCNSTLIMDYSGSFYTVTPSSFLQDAVFKNGELFVSFGRAEYVTKYAKEWKEDAEIIGQDTDYEIRYSAEEDAEDRLLENPEVNSKLLDTSFFSEDGLYIFAMFKNNVGRIYDADTLQCLASFDIVETVYSKLWLSENTEFYILDSLYDSYVFDENWNIIFKTSKIVAEEDGFFIVSRADDTLCSIPYYDYEYILELADEYLGDYKPSSATKEKYNIR
ncbi:MAG: hypothetical protein J5570_08465, partial [Lachnospiraceae bacterium]|nr:hypothetical protein [Lachnospiraceae bacterium]